MKKILFLLGFSLFSSQALADVSVHILDTQKGQPSTGVKVEMFAKNEENQWTSIGTQVTDEKGRIATFEIDKKAKNKSYRAVFYVGEFFKKHQQDSFYDTIPVDFVVTDPTQHYHIPLLLSPYAYSTYRGN